MKKMMNFLVPVKFVAGGVLAGLLGFYMVVGALYAYLRGLDFVYSIPFAFVIQGAVLAILIAAVWELCMGDTIIKKWRFVARAWLFNGLLAVLVGVCFATSFVLPADWAYVWLTGAGVITVGFAVMAGLYEWYCRRVGKRYTEALHRYQEIR